MSVALAARASELSLESKRELWTVVIVIGASLPHWPALSPWIPALLVASVAWRLGVAFYGWRPPSRVVRLPLALGSFLAVLFQHRTLNGVEAGSALLVVMVALKVLESRSQRDQLVLIMLCYFLMFAALLADRGPLTVAYVGVLVWLTTVALIQIGRRGELLPYRATGRFGGRLLLHALPVMIALFVLFPRLPGPLWGIPGSTSSGATGLSDTMSPGDITNLALSDEVAFRVEFEGRAPRASDLYWRGPSLTNFNGRTWSLPQGGRRGERVAATVEYRGAPTSYHVTLEPNGRNWAFALDMPRQWSGEVRMGSDYQLAAFFGGGPRARRLDYRVTSHVEYRAREPLTEGEREMFRALPPGSNPRARELAESWIADGASGATIVQRSMDYLRSQPFVYTLTPPALGAQPVDEFLFETRRGFCEHFANAFVVLMRSAGVPARVVLGYQGGELNPVDGTLVVRQSDAHAWAEVWLERRGWVRIDPTAAAAPKRINEGLVASLPAGDPLPFIARVDAQWLRSLRNRAEAISHTWNTWVLGYNAQRQRDLLTNLGFDPDWRSMTALLAAGVAAWQGVVWVALFRNRRRLSVTERSWQNLVKKLQRHGLTPEPSEGPIAFAARAGTIHTEWRDALNDFAARYARITYGPPASAHEADDLSASIKAWLAENS